MAISADYVSASQFRTEGDAETVAGNATDDFRVNRVILATYADLTESLHYVVASEYDAELENTLVTVYPESLADNLATVEVGATYVDFVAESTNLSPHGHRAWFDGGELYLGLTEGTPSDGSIPIWDAAIGKFRFETL